MLWEGEGRRRDGRENTNYSKSCTPIKKQTGGFTLSVCG